MAKRDHQVSVPLPAYLREFVERQAAQQDRSVGLPEGQIRLFPRLSSFGLTGGFLV